MCIQRLDRRWFSGVVVCLLLAVSAVSGTTANRGVIQTMAGNGAVGFFGDADLATAAQLSLPQGVGVAPNGDVYIADTDNHRVRRVSAATGIITTVAGTGTPGFAGDGGLALSAQLNEPVAVVVDATGHLYIADRGNDRIRRVAAGTAIITTVAGGGTEGLGDGGLATSARMNAPQAVAVTTSTLYVADAGDHRVRAIALSGGLISTVAGSGTAGFSGEGGPAVAADLQSPSGLAVSASALIIADTANHRLRRLDFATGLLTTIAGTGVAGSTGDGAGATAAQLNQPAGLTIDEAGAVYVAETAGARVRRVDPVTSIITTVVGTGAQGYAGDGDLATSALLQGPTAVAIDLDGRLLIADRGNSRVRDVFVVIRTIRTVAGTGESGFSIDGGLAVASALRRPVAVTVDDTGDVYIADQYDQRIRRVAAATGAITTVAGTGVSGFSGDGGSAVQAALSDPASVVLDAEGRLVIADSANHRVRRVDLATGIITTIAGTGVGGFGGDGGQATAALLNGPSALALESTGALLVADTLNSRVRRISPQGVISTVAGTGTAGFSGDGGAASAAALSQPQGLAVGGDGSVYIADSGNDRVRRVAPNTSIITTIAGGGVAGIGDGGQATAAQLSTPSGLSLDGGGDLFIADQTHHRIRKVALASGLIWTVAGSGTAAFTGDGGDALDASLSSPEGIVSWEGRLFIVDSGNASVRRAAPGRDGTVATITTQPLSRTVLAGASTTFVVVAEGTALTYQWQTRATSSDAWQVVPATTPYGGTTTATLTITAVPLSLSGAQYRVLITNASGSAASDPATLTVTAAPAIVTPPASVTAAVGAATTFSVTVSGTPTPSVRWQRRASPTAEWTDVPDVAPFTGPTTVVLQISAAARELDGSQFRAVVTNGSGTAASDPATLTVFERPLIVTQPVDRTTSVGGNATFTVVATGLPHPTYQWRRRASATAAWATLSDGTGVSGATSSSLILSAVAAAQAGSQYECVVTNIHGSASTAVVTLFVAGSLSVDRTALRFAGVQASGSATLTAKSGREVVQVSFSGSGGTWVAQSDRDWIVVGQGAGTGNGTFHVDITSPGVTTGATVELTGTVTVTAASSSNTSVSIPITLTLTRPEAPSVTPQGQVDTPAQNTTGAQGAIAMTGWVVDDVGIQHVRIYRQCLSFESAPAPAAPAAPCQDVLGQRVVLVGEASIIPGARPDVEALFPTLPANRSAGWGFLILSNLLPNIPASNASGGGVGTFHLYAVATDAEGNQKLLGRAYTDATSVPTSVTVANDTIAKPFGAIDTPGQGATVGGSLNNFGWVLTPDSNTVSDGTDILVPLTGATISVVIDGTAVGTATYNLCRGTVGNPVPSGVLCDDDVSSIFRGTNRHRNLDAGRGAIGLRTIDTTTLSNGLHTIQWGVSDSAFRSEGIGSRYFTVLNGSGDAALARTDRARLASLVPARAVTLFGRTGFDFSRALTALESVNGIPTIHVPESGRVEVQVPGVTAGAWIANGDVRDLPVGMAVNTDTGIVTWSVGPGFLGTYRLRFAAPEAVDVAIVVVPQFTSAEPVRMHVDRAAPLEGWAFDPQAETGAGIGAVHVWGRKSGFEPVFLGLADLHISRPDVAAAHGARFDRAGWRFSGVVPEAGEWEITAYVWSIRTGRFEDARSVKVVVK